MEYVPGECGIKNYDPTVDLFHHNKNKKGNESLQTAERYFDLHRIGYTCCCIYASNAWGKVVIGKLDDR